MPRFLADGTVYIERSTVFLNIAMTSLTSLLKIDSQA